jgi:hypothetical protein
MEEGAVLRIDLSSVAIHDSQSPVDISRLHIFEKYLISSTSLNRFLSKLLLKFSSLLPSVDFKQHGFPCSGPFDRSFRWFRTIHLHGYFADFSYSANSDLFTDSVNLPGSSLWFNETAKKISLGPAVAIHVRRGDFLTNPEHYGILSAEYYRRALAIIPLELRSAKFFVFSDSPSAAHETLSQISEFQFEYVSPPSDSNALESLILISLAKVQILANSTFSFWAGFLSKNTSLVCYPNKDKQGRDIAGGIPEDWVAIEEDWE